MRGEAVLVHLLHHHKAEAQTDNNPASIGFSRASEAKTRAVLLEAKLGTALKEANPRAALLEAKHGAALHEAKLGAVHSRPDLWSSSSRYLISFITAGRKAQDTIKFLTPECFIALVY